jgi:hypothetical protein
MICATKLGLVLFCQNYSNKFLLNKPTYKCRLSDNYYQKFTKIFKNFVVDLFENKIVCYPNKKYKINNLPTLKYVHTKHFHITNIAGDYTHIIFEQQHIARSGRGDMGVMRLAYL